MNFDFSPEQEELRRQCSRFFDAQGPCVEARKVMDGGGYDHADWLKIAEMGWLGAAIAEDYGGVGLGVLELCVLFEEFGKAIAPLPFASTIFAAEAIKRAGSEEQKAKYLPQIAQGDMVGAIALFDEGARTAFSSAKAMESKGFISGAKAPVADLEFADFVVLAATGEGRDAVGLYVLDLPDNNAHIDALDGLDLVRSHARLRLDGAKVEPLGTVHDGLSHIRALLDLSAVLMAFEQLGGAEAAMMMALTYAKERYAFGRAIGGNQAIKHKLADMFVKNQLARSHAYYGAWALDSAAPELPRAAAGAHLAAGDAYDFAAQECVEIHGGIGFTWDSDCQFFYRRARLLSQSLGAKSYWVDQLVEQLRGRNT